MQYCNFIRCRGYPSSANYVGSFPPQRGKPFLKVLLYKLPKNLFSLTRASLRSSMEVA